MSFSPLEYLYKRFFWPLVDQTDREYLDFIVRNGSGMTQEQFLEREISRYTGQKEYKDIITAYNYYHYNQDILAKRRTMIDKNGIETELHYLPNNKIIDNQYQKIVDQKVNYLIGKPITFTSDNQNYSKMFQSYIDSKFLSKFNGVAIDSVNMGVGYEYPYYDASGNLQWQVFRPWEIIPFWKDDQCRELDAFARVYKRYGYDKTIFKSTKYVDFYTIDNVTHYIYENGTLRPDNNNPVSNYFFIGDTPYRWNRVPLIPFKRKSNDMRPLLNQCKCLQDAINSIESNFKDNMDEDFRSSPLVVINYDGEELDKFRYNLLQTGCVKVTTIDGQKGDVKALHIEVNKDNFESILDMAKQAMIENCRGYNVRDNRLTSDANQMHIQSMFADVDLDADFQATEYKSAFEDIKYFIDFDLNLKGKGDFFDEPIKVTFNRNLFINDATVIQNLAVSADMLSKQTLLAHHPYVDDVQAELERIKADAANGIIYSPINQQTPPAPEDGKK